MDGATSVGRFRRRAVVLSVVLLPAVGSMAACDGQPRAATTEAPSERSSPAVAASSTRAGTSAPAPRVDGPLTRVVEECPWIASKTAAALEGNRIGQVFVSRQGGRVVGCEFHFDTNWGADRVVMTIYSTRFPDPTAARNAMIRLGEAGSNPAGQPDIADGVDGIRYQTPLLGENGATDWAFSFAKDDQVVTIKTDQNVSINAYNVALAIVDKV